MNNEITPQWQKITPENRPRFPCWIWTRPIGKVAFCQRVHAERLFDPRRFGGRACICTHWHPDQSTAPTAQPEQPAATGTPEMRDLEAQHSQLWGECKQLLRDLNAARAEVERLTRERDIELERATHYRDQWQTVSVQLAAIGITRPKEDKA